MRKSLSWYLDACSIEFASSSTEGDYKRAHTCKPGVFMHVCKNFTNSSARKTRERQRNSYPEKGEDEEAPCISSWGFVRKSSSTLVLALNKIEFFHWL